MHKDYDLVCVGSGITLLSFVLTLLRKDPGKKILILEKHRLVGGYSTCFHRPNQHSIFDVSLHKLTGMGETGNLHKVLADYGMLDTVQMVYADCMFVASIDGRKISFWHDEKILFDHLRSFCDEEDLSALKEFFSDVLSYGYDSYMQHQIFMGNYEPDFKRLRFAHKNLKQITVYDKLKQIFKNRILQNIISTPCMYVGALPEEASYLYFLHVWYAAFFARTAYPAKGSQALSNFFRDEIIKRGGHFRLREAAEKVRIDPATNTCTEIITNKGVYTAPEFILNTSHQYALSLIDDAEKTSIQIDETRLPAPANSTTTVYVVLHESPEEMGLTVEETMIFPQHYNDMKDYRDMARQNLHDETICERVFWELSPMEITNYHLVAPTNGKVIVLNVLDRIEHWPERKTQAYKNKKKRAENILLQRLVEEFPLMKGKIKYAEVASPKTYVKYTNNTSGSGYGYLILGKAPRLPMNICKNLRLVSQWVSGGGYEATICFGHMLAEMENKNAAT
ncbi:NAD(P)-binding protein [Acetobacteraceae bacterium ESL0709]|nr:NAD(P)-binding protein [Acetobacteraceae bacterium ESL0697]MDF7678592.1 NAD(P)-binding protein [Acetobacteraceae bacterium ESL0709]